MTPEQFAYWLRGFLESKPERSLSIEDVSMIGDHLDLVIEPQTARKKEREAARKERRARKREITRGFLRGEPPKDTAEREALRVELKKINEEEMKELLRPYRTTSYDPHKRIC